MGYRTAVAMGMAGLMILALAVAPAHAQDPIHKAGRGVANVLTSWIEIPKNVQLGMLEENPVTGVIWGLIKGFGLGATRVLVGAYEAVSFPFPYPKDYASPYEGLELPDYPWQ